MPFLDRRTADILLTILFFGVVCVAVYSARRIILIFVFAIFFAYLINPIVKFLQRHSLFFRSLRGPAVIEAYLAFVILLAVIGYEFTPGLARNTAKLLDEVPVVLDGLATGNIATELAGKYGWSREQEFRFRAFLARHRESIEGLVATADGYLSNAAQVAGCLLLIPILAIFFLRDGDHIADIFINLFFPPTQRARVLAVAKDLHFMLTRYLRAQLILCVLSFAFYFAALLFLSFPHAIVLAALGGLLEFIPAIGWLTTAAVIFGIGVVNHLPWVWMMSLLGAWRIIQDYYLTPRIMGRHLKIHPLAAIFAVLVGAEIGGVVGMYLAVPLMASMRVIWRAYAGGQLQEGYYRDLNTEAPASSGLAETATI